MMWWEDGGWTAGTWIMMSLMMVVVWGGPIALVVWLVHGLRQDSGSVPAPPPATNKADELLAERLASGEIDEEEFTRRRAALHSRT